MYGSQARHSSVITMSHSLRNSAIVAAYFLCIPKFLPPAKLFFASMILPGKFVFLLIESFFLFVPNKLIENDSKKINENLDDFRMKYSEGV